MYMSVARLKIKTAMSRLLITVIIIVLVAVNYCYSTSYSPYYCNPQKNDTLQKISDLDKTCAYVPSINETKSNLLCSCKNECGPAIWSVPVACVDCSNSHGQWMGIIIFNLSLLTLLFFVSMLLRINVAACPLNVIVYFYQNITVYIEASYTLSGGIMVSKRPDLKMLVTIYGFFNLDFFRYVIPPQCIDIDYFNVLYFEYIVAAFPFLLCLIAYLLIKLYDKDVRCVVRAWRPFSKCFKGDKWNPRVTIINTYITFFLLSQSKIILTTFKIFYPVMNNNVTYLHFIPSFNLSDVDQNLSYRFLKSISLIILFIFVLAPVLLQILYPTKLFWKCLNMFRCLRQDILIILMDAFQGWYKDGTNGSRDYRYMSVVFMVLRLSYLSLAFLSFANKDIAVVRTVVVMSFVHCAIGVFYFTAQPYKHSWMNKVDGTILVLLGMILCANTSPAVYSSVSVAVWIPVVPLLFRLLYLPYHLYVSCKKHKFVKRSKSSLKRKFKSKAHNKTITNADRESSTPVTNMNSSISADRVLYPRKYEESIFNRNQADQSMPEDPEGARGRRGSLVPLLLGRHDTTSVHSVDQSQSMTILSTGCVNTDYGITTSPIIGDPYDIL